MGKYFKKKVLKNFRPSESTILNFANKHLSNNENYIFFVFLLVGATLFLKLVGANAIITVLFFFLVGIVVNLKIKDWVASYLLVTLYTLQFYVPNKYYAVQVFNPGDLILGFGSYLLSYGVNLQNVFLLLTLFLLIRNLIIKKWHLDGKVIKQLLTIFIPATIYFAVSSYSTSRFSPYPNLSTVWLLQYMSMFIIAGIICVVFENKRGLLKLIFPLILSSIYLQSFLASIQFLKQSWVGLPVESYKAGTAFYGAPDAINGFFRVVGTFGHPNQFALIMCLIVSLIIPHVFKPTNSKYIFGLVMSLPIIIFTQSRSGWVALFFIAILTISAYKNEITKLISYVGIIRFYITITLVVLGTSAILFPRLIASYNTFSDNAGATLRLEMQKEALVAFKMSPLVGYGVGTNEPTLLKLFPKGYVYTFPAPIHMFYIQMILESGLVGLFAFTFPFLYIFKYVINLYLLRKKNKMSLNKEYIYIFIAGSVAAGVYYLFQPHQGFIDFPYLGLILGFGLLNIYNLRYKKIT